MQEKGTAEGFTIPSPVTSSSEEEEDLEHEMEEELKLTGHSLLLRYQREW